MRLTPYRLGEFCQMKYGKMPSNDILSDEGFPVFTGYRITGYAKEYLFDEPRVVVVARGVGGTGDVKMSPKKSWITNLSIVLDPDKQIVNEKFLFYRLGLEPLKDKLNTGAAQAQITIDSLKSYFLPLPSLKEQRRIASILSAYDDLIENNRRRIQLLEQAARLLYKEWFIRLHFPGHEHVKIKNGVPEGWEKKMINDVAGANEQSYGKGNLPETINYIDISSVSQGRILSKTDLHASEAPGRARRRAKHGDTIWSNVRPNLRAYSLVLEPEENDVFSTGFTVLTAKTVPFTYLYQFVTTDDFVSYLVNHTTGASYPAVRPPDFERTKILVPTETLLQKFHETVEPYYCLISSLDRGIKVLTKARDLLLPHLMNG
ncbi:MAG: hypothetical protein F4142_02170 [Nitrospira sp. SB0675_bin_23]|nr:hypothetical protein [Nitrospira sp. SB0667_bin_9]MYD32214.1 hypothetical protein [Nitrospira sp. SB0661_bin_20]MYH01396.1 hypothetical protein [Nitrospira sp. SB0675_bin_23]MYJ23258.1 hypothetical protein [Nitrospira sp. SB0673_bin_12]